MEKRKTKQTTILKYNIHFYMVYYPVILTLMRCTHSVKVNIISSVLWSFVQRAVMSSHLLPGAVKVVRHHIYKVQVPDETQIKINLHKKTHVNFGLRK